MGATCGAQASCCAGDAKDGEVNISKADQQMLMSQGITGARGSIQVNSQSVHLQGTRGVPTRLYAPKEIRKIIHLQACARRWLAQRLLRNVIDNPDQFLRPTFFRESQADYSSEIVDDKLDELGIFTWDD